jgi:hypothetical protein
VLQAYADFVGSGVVKALSESLPFDIVGSTTNAAVTASESEPVQLTLTVLTSDDLTFSAAMSDPIDGEDEAPFYGVYNAAAAASGKGEERPTFLLSFAPLLHNVGGDFIVNTLNAASGGVPDFGTMAVDNTEDYHDSITVFNGEGYPRSLGILLVYGDVTPRYYRASISEERIFREEGVVTASAGNQLQTINDMPVEDYLVSLGIRRGADGHVVGVNAYPFIVNYNDGTPPVVRILFAITPEGYAVCGGDIPVGSTLSVGSIDGESVVRATTAAIQQLLEDGKPNALIMFSCIGRYFALGFRTTLESDAVAGLLNEAGVPFAFAYSGGEFCPTPGRDAAAAPVNRFHNDTFVALAL